MFTEVQEQGHSGMLGLLIETESQAHSLMHEIKGWVHSLVHPSLHLVLDIQSTDDI